MRFSIYCGLVLIAAHVSGCADVSAPELVEVDCGPAREGGYVDPFARSEISVLSCPHPSAPSNLLIATDANISWPVIQFGGTTTSFEDWLLAGSPELGDGLFYFDRDEDRVIWIGRSATKVVISLTGADPITLSERRRWIAIDLARSEIVGVSDKLAEAVRPR